MLNSSNLRQRPLTPDPKTPEPLSYREQQTRASYAEYLLSKERRRHSGTEAYFLKALNELQDNVSVLREMYLSAIAPKPSHDNREKK